MFYSSMIYLLRTFSQLSWSVSTLSTSTKHTQEITECNEYTVVVPPREGQVGPDLKDYNEQKILLLLITVQKKVTSLQQTRVHFPLSSNN